MSEKSTDNPSPEKLIEKLTPEQEALMPVVRDLYLEIGLRTEQKIDRDAARDAIRTAYQCGALVEREEAEEPMEIEAKWIYFARSPEEASLMVALLRTHYEDPETGEQLPVNAPNAKNYSPDGVKLLTQEDLEERLTELYSLQQNDQPLPERIAAAKQEAFTWACYGQHDAGWLSLYDFFQRIGVTDLEVLEGLKKAAQHCGWWWAMDECAVVSALPVELHRDDQRRLHHESGMAIRFSDDWGLYHWHGVEVPKHVITDPTLITISEIMEQSNQEVRRVMIVRMGQERFLEESQAELVHQDSFGKLWRIQVAEQDTWMGVEVINKTPEPDGSHKHYVLRVPIESDLEDGKPMTTAHQAVAWTFGKTPETYQPDVET